MTEDFVLPDFSGLGAAVARADLDTARAALGRDRLSIADLAALLSPAAEALLPEMAARSRALTAQRFGQVIQLYAPLYIHNLCVNRCAYCGFSSGNTIPRRALSIEDCEAEAQVLIGRGIRHVLLVAGEAPRKADVDFFATLALRLRERFASLSIEVQPLAIEGYARLFQAGITAVTVYQETYDPVVYDQVHLAGAKRDYRDRLQVPARAAAAGMREVGIGALLGLADWRAEGLAIGIHLAWLRRRFWQTGFTVSFPRLRPAAGEFEPLVRTTEKNLSQLIFALRLFDPDVGLILSTREEARYRDGMLGLGPTRYSAGSCTAPGGYVHPELAGEQFSIGDHRAVREVRDAIHEKGLDPVRKDWDPEFQPRAAA